MGTLAPLHLVDLAPSISVRKKDPATEHLRWFGSGVDLESDVNPMCLYMCGLYIPKATGL